MSSRCQQLKRAKTKPIVPSQRTKKGIVYQDGKFHTTCLFQQNTTEKKAVNHPQPHQQRLSRDAQISTPLSGKVHLSPTPIMPMGSTQATRTILTPPPSLSKVSLLFVFEWGQRRPRPWSGHSLLPRRQCVPSCRVGEDHTRSNNQTLSLLFVFMATINRALAGNQNSYHIQKKWEGTCLTQESTEIKQGPQTSSIPWQ
jgi:hypothetical protein